MKYYKSIIIMLYYNSINYWKIILFEHYHEVPCLDSSIYSNDL